MWRRADGSEWKGEKGGEVGKVVPERSPALDRERESVVKTILTKLSSPPVVGMESRQSECSWGKKRWSV